MIIKANGKDITSLAGSITLDSSLDTLGDQLGFEIAYSQNNAEVNVGDLIQLFNDKEVFRGIVVTKTRNEKSQSFNCFDYAFYLNKSKVIKQFNKVKADVAIKTLLSEFNVPVGTIASMPTIISQIYYDKEVSSVIKDIIEQTTNTTGKKYVMEMNVGKLDIRQDADLVINVKVQLADNLAAVDIGKTISNPSKSASIEEMKNSIKLYTGGEDGVKVYAEVKNDALIKKYGLLQETQSLEDKDIAQARNIAQNLLKDLGRVLVEGSIEVLGHFDLRAGRILQLNEPITNLVGKYKIKSVSHNIGNIHTASLSLVEV
ncbi:MAG: hypothetical protein PHW03_05915 [Eubacteriales bacterium]|nr:hypothetical protein [Eubacteriales bacterium]MDD4390323.1 hypothetical protein [Eubacteriales bacterium]